MKNNERRSHLEQRLKEAYGEPPEGQLELSQSARYAVMRAVRTESSHDDERRASLALRWSFAAALASFALSAYVMPREAVDPSPAAAAAQDDDDDSLSGIITSPLTVSLEEL